MSSYLDDDKQALQDLLALIRIKSVSALGPSGSYAAIAQILQNLCERVGLSTEIIEPVTGKPIVLATWPGLQPDLPSLLLTGHYDVVPVVEDQWSCDPFGGIVRDGVIFGRGTQDMKSCLVAYIHCVHRLKRAEFIPKHTVHLVFVPDEEIGGKDGMEAFVATPRFRELNVGFAIDEGLCSPNETVPVYYGERAMWWLRLVATGEVGHASTFLKETALERLHRCLSNFYEFRQSEIAKYPESDFGDLVAVNVTAVSSGNQSVLNVIPDRAVAGIDIRIPATVDLGQFEQKLRQWTDRENISIEKLVFCESNPITILDNNPWWNRLETTLSQMGLKIEPKIFPAATDSRFLRKLGISCLGLSPFPNTPVKFHDHDECISLEVFLNAIPIYSSVVESLCKA